MPKFFPSIKRLVDILEALVIKKDGSVAFTENQSMGGKKLTNLLDPTSDQDAMTKKYTEDNYIPYSDILMPLNVFGGKKVFIPELNTLFYKAETRMTVTQTGFNTWVASKVFNLSYDNRNEILVNGIGVISIDTRPDWGGFGITYPQGYIVLSFYHTNIPESVSGRYKDNNDNWHAFTDPVNISTNPSYAIWRLTVPYSYYARIFEITINAQAGIVTNLTQIDYFAFRKGSQKLPWQV